jgi:hypothetical protein
MHETKAYHNGSSIHNGKDYFATHYYGANVQTLNLDP